MLIPAANGVMRSFGPVVTSHKVPGMNVPGQDGDLRGAGRGPASSYTALSHSNSGRAAARPAPPSAQHRAQGSTSVEELVRLLGGVRTALGYSEIELAMRLGTTPRVVFALENGWLEALPPWTETRRIVDGWVAAAGLDPRPALEALGQVMQATPVATIRTANPFEVPDVARASGQDLVRAMRQPASRTVSESVASAVHSEMNAQKMMSDAAPQQRDFGRPSWLRMPAMRWGRLAALAVAAAGLWMSTTQTAVVAAAVATLPAPAERAVRSISDFVAVRLAPLREGHRWISVDDPRSRRGDKLRIGHRSD